MAVTKVSGVQCVHSVVSVLPEYHRTVDCIVEDLVQRSGLVLFQVTKWLNPSIHMLYAILNADECELYLF